MDAVRNGLHTIVLLNVSGMKRRKKKAPTPSASSFHSSSLEASTGWGWGVGAGIRAGRVAWVCALAREAL